MYFPGLLKKKDCKIAERTEGEEEEERRKGDCSQEVW